MEVENYIVCGCDHGKTFILCPRQVSQFRRSCGSHARCTAILVWSMMILSVFLPHSVCDGEDHITELEVVRIIMEEEKDMGAKATSTSS